MPIQIEYVDGGQGALFRGTGVVTGEDISSANKEMFSTLEKTRGYKYGLADWTGVTDFKVSPSEIKDAVAQNKRASEHLPELFVATVADRDLVFGFSRMWSAYIEAYDLDWEVMLFRDRTSAESWLKEKVRAKNSIDVDLI